MGHFGLKVRDLAIPPASGAPCGGLRSKLWGPSSWDLIPRSGACQQGSFLRAVSTDTSLTVKLHLTSFPDVRHPWKLLKCLL